MWVALATENSRQAKLIIFTQWLRQFLQFADITAQVLAVPKWAAQSLRKDKQQSPNLTLSHEPLQKLQGRDTQIRPLLQNLKLLKLN